MDSQDKKWDRRAECESQVELKKEEEEEQLHTAREKVVLCYAYVADAFMLFTL